VLEDLSISNAQPVCYSLTYAHGKEMPVLDGYNIDIGVLVPVSDAQECENSRVTGDNALS